MQELDENNFTVTPSEGELDINQTELIAVQFYAQQAKKIESMILIEVYDSKYEKVKGSHVYEIKLLAEGFEILVDFKGFETEN